jgi:hypothetical protein
MSISPDRSSAALRERARRPLAAPVVGGDRAMSISPDRSSAALRERAHRRRSAAIGVASTAVAIGLSIAAAFGGAVLAGPLLVLAMLAPIAWSVLPSPAVTTVSAQRAALVITVRALPPPPPRRGRLGSSELAAAAETSPQAWMMETAPITRLAIDVH